MQETWVQSLDWEDPLEKGKATCSSILAWRIPRTVKSIGSQKVRQNWETFTSVQITELMSNIKIQHCREPAYCILSAALSTASSFRIWNSSTGSLSLPGASVRSSAHGKGHEEGGSAYAKAGLSLRSPPENSRASTPKTRVCLLSALCSHLHLWLYGGLSPTTSLWKKS